MYNKIRLITNKLKQKNVEFSLGNSTFFLYYMNLTLNIYNFMFIIM